LFIYIYRAASKTSYDDDNDSGCDADDDDDIVMRTVPSTSGTLSSIERSPDSVI
jgi:hypothetical protein